MHLPNVHALLSCVVLNDQLLKEEESTLVINALSYLHLRHPQMGCVSLLAVIALLVGDHVLNHE
jgi:hypothetical protein